MATGGWDPVHAVEDARYNRYDRYDRDGDNDQRTTTTTTTERQWKICAICNRRVENLAEHYDECLSMQSTDQRKSMETTSEKSAAPKRKRTKDCIMCFKPIPEDDYATHVTACVSEAAGEMEDEPQNRPNRDSCFNCASPVDCNGGTGFIISCEGQHIYCIRCIQTAMNKYLSTGSEPVCHAEFCPYRLSCQDLLALPLAHQIRQRLIKLVKTKRRPQCDVCRFYIDMTNMYDLEKHLQSCDLDQAIPCEYCLCPQKPTELEEHSRQCRSDVTQRRKTLVDFIVARTKYPFDAKQIDFFLDKRKNEGSPIDPRSVVDALVVYEEVFPLELPTRECNICMESCLFEDIFVVDCPEDHKLCYKCYEHACRTQMSNNEVLTCPLCTYQLQYGDLKQLRVSPDERRLIIDYQTDRTFARFTSNSRGIIKCPKQQCTWMVETADPNARFRVVCDLCENEFCSLCNQQYHYRTTCQEIPKLTQRWYLWCNSERGRYLATRAQQDKTYAAQLTEYERRRAADEKRNTDLRRHYNETLQDEKYKADNCRLCPHCGRVVQHMGGCSSMTCGRDYHGGNQQSGCGKNFTWDEAKVYVAASVQKPDQIARDLPRPESPVVTHENIMCDGCHNVIRGIRFDCVHCPALIFCEKCEQQRSLEHSNENEFEGKQQHVFQLITTPVGASMRF